MTKPTTGDAGKELTVYQVRDFIDAAELRRDLAYSPNNLTDAMMQQASMFSHYGVLAAEAAKQTDVVKMLVENTEAAVQQIIRNELAAASEKITESAIAAKVARHPRVISMKKALNEAKRIESIGKTAVEAFRHRRDMLVQQGLISREEMKGELSIRERSAREDALEASKIIALDRLARRNAGNAAAENSQN
ncbi:hypothetical protein SAMN05216358_0138 [Rhizobium sp. AN5]|uniref:hypothetical protein n=1 Tax=Rhizobium sp. AN5 TaxID=1855304 RepID=UPI000BCB0243|nr:hypothetical protein [Rhizobium sp. AN5]SOC90114.1 hypothetical protein SAMN05216358_0138 [Rhizobium sp. AN5]